MLPPHRLEFHCTCLAFLLLGCGGRLGYEDSDTGSPEAAKTCLETTIDTDENADGLFDQRIVRVEDADGQTWSYATFEKPFGEHPATLALYSYDEDGQLLVRRVDDDGDGAFDTVEKRSYERGRLSVVEQEIQGRSVVIEWTYDENGYPRSRRSTSEDAALEEEVDYEYDARGNLLARETNRKSGVPKTTVERYGYDEQDRKVSYAITQLNGEAIFSASSETWIYDEQGRITSHVITRARAEGASEVTTESTEYGPGSETLRVFVGQATIPASVARTDYDEQQRPIRYEADSNGDGAADQSKRWFYDNGKEWTRLEESPSDFTQTARVTERDFDAEGRLVTYREDHDDDGSWDLTQVLGYAPIGCGT